jgi:phosphoribosyl-ATP pyrophosphohydrolase/phosphoribosyl-AMP cyclohydrolase
MSPGGDGGARSHAARARATNARSSDRRLASTDDLDALRFDARGLLPVVAQDAASGAVLMLAWANREALERSLESGEMMFWSRSRNALWKKGETSGNVLRLRSLHADCDGDTVLALVDPVGPVCHTGDRTCFGEGVVPSGVLGELWRVLESRAAERPQGSYTTRLLDDPNLRTKKLGEETAELVAALARGDAQNARTEGADLVYHLLVALLGAGVSLDDLLEELDTRRK